MKRAAWVLFLVAGLCFALFESARAGKSGVWKPADESNNFYVQTYSTGSCVVIVTPDGTDFYVFLDPECDNQVLALEYFGRPASLNVTFTSDQTATADLVIGTVRAEYTLNRLFEGDCRDGDGNATITNSLGMTFVYIPPGTFTMGSPTGELGRGVNETQHEVTLTPGFYMQTTEITQGQWQAVMGANPSDFSSCGNNCPVETVSWEDLQTFIATLNTMGEGRYRLPTEAEWEYAARAGSTTAFASGDITEPGCDLDPNLDAMGWYCYNSGDMTHPVAQKNPNAWGVYDMHGNVFELCQDWYGDYPAGSVTDPTGPSTGSLRVGRGGCWNRSAMDCRSASRFYGGPNDRNNRVGARLVRSLP